MFEPRKIIQTQQKQPIKPLKEPKPRNTGILGTGFSLNRQNNSRNPNYARQSTRANRNFQYTATLQGLFIGKKQKNKNIRFTGLEVRGL